LVVLVVLISGLTKGSSEKKGVETFVVCDRSALSMEEKAVQLLQHIISNWARKPTSTLGFHKATGLLSRQQP